MEVLPDPVEVSDIELPEEKGGSERSEREGEEGLRRKEELRGDSSLLRVSYWPEQSDIVLERGDWLAEIGLKLLNRYL